MPELAEVVESTPEDNTYLARALANFTTFCAFLVIRVKEGPPQSFRFANWFHEQKTFERLRTGFDIVLKPRQVGFTTLELARDLWYALMHPGSQVLVIAHDKELAETLFQTLHVFCDSLRALGLLPKTKYSNRREVVFADTNSAVRIVEAGSTEASAAKKGRTGTIHRLHATEVAFWGAAQETMAAVLSAVPAGGEVVIESTANGAGGMFFEDVQAARSGTSGYRLHFFAWFDHAEYRRPANDNFDPAPANEWEEKLRAYGCDDEQIAWWRYKVNDPKVGLENTLQEFPVNIDTCFRASGEAWFAARDIDWLSTKTSEPKRLARLEFNGLRFEPACVWQEPERGADYIIGADAAQGIARDGSAAVVIHRGTGLPVATWWNNWGTPPSEFGLVLAVLGWLYNTALVVPERNDPGPAVLGALRREAHYPRVYQADDGQLGFHTNSKTRSEVWDGLAQAIRERVIWTPCAATVGECKTIIRDEDGQPRARGKKKKKTADSSRDDRFVAWGIGWRIRSMSPAVAGSRSFHVPGL